MAVSLPLLLLCGLYIGGQTPTRALEGEMVAAAAGSSGSKGACTDLDSGAPLALKAWTPSDLGSAGIRMYQSYVLRTTGMRVPLLMPASKKCS